MRLIEGARGSGKTTELIYKSAELGVPIIAPTMFMCGCIKAAAQKYGCDIPEPVSINKVVNLDKGRLKKYLIDELDLCLQQLGIEVEYVTVSNKEDGQ